MKKILTSFITVITLSTCYGQSDKVSIAGAFTQLNDSDKVNVNIYKYGDFPFDITELKTTYSARVKDHRFTLYFQLPKGRLYNCIISIPKLRVYFPWLPIEAGDQLRFSGTDSTYSDFSGSGSKKLNMMLKFQTFNNLPAYVKAQQDHSVTGLSSLIQASEIVMKNRLKYLNRHSREIDNKAFNQLKAESAGLIWMVYYSIKYSDMDKDSVRQFLSTKWLPFRNRNIKTYPLSAAVADYGYAGNMANDYALTQIITNNNFNSINPSNDLKAKYFYFKLHSSGFLREKMLTYLILSASQSNEIAYCYEDALKLIRNPDFRLALTNHSECIPGNPAFNFTLTDTNNVAHRLSEFRGKVIVVDFWFTGCENCIELNPKLKFVEDKFKNDTRVVFLSVSSDKSMATWKKSVSGGMYTSSGEVNLYTGGGGRADPLYQKSNFQGAPTLRMIDDEGNWCANPIDCRMDDGKDLIDKIQLALATVK